jgi:peptidyl-prolyl cis-trans isomerase C
MRPLALARTSALALAMALPTLALAQQPAPAASQPAPPKPAPDTVVARVDGVAITESDLAIAEADPALSLPGMSDAQKRDLLIGYLVDLKIGARAAEAAKVGEGADFARRLTYFRDKLLLDDYLEAEVKKAVTPEAARKLYDDAVKGMKPETEVRARHILVKTEDEAKKALARLRGGEDFVKVATEISQDPGSKTDGGDLGFFTQDRMVAPFAEAAFKLEPGKLSEPVQTQFGWHVIRVEEKRTKPLPTFDEMKEQIDTYLARQAQQNVILRLRQAAKVERLDQPAKPDEKK